MDEHINQAILGHFGQARIFPKNSTASVLMVPQLYAKYQQQQQQKTNESILRESAVIKTGRI